MPTNIRFAGKDCEGVSSDHEDTRRKPNASLDTATTASAASILLAQSEHWLLPRDEFHRGCGTASTRA